MQDNQRCSCAMSEQPLVSVGIPTYNRPAGLRRVLECITTQTYQNLEIIVSDNASPDPEVEIIAREFAHRDPRIQYYRQEKNKGCGFNFHFVLQQAHGQYFMWAADDDEWELNFIEVCMNAMLCHNVGSVMTSYKVIYRNKQKTEARDVPELSETLSIRENYISCLLNIRPALFYGIHKKETIQYFLHLPMFDWSDLYLMLRQILGCGFLTIPDQHLFLSGIEGDMYIYKPHHPSKSRLFEYRPIISYALRDLLATRRVNVFVKFQLLYVFLKKMSELFIYYEKNARPHQVQLVEAAWWFMSLPELIVKKLKNFVKRFTT
jgi:glycosyltransferase involved in cell wall biosynthesis